MSAKEELELALEIEKLAVEVVDEWDMDTLISYARDNMAQYYHSDNDAYLEELESRA